MDTLRTLRAFGVTIHPIPELCARGLYLPDERVLLIRDDLPDDEVRQVAALALDEVVLTPTA